jgi:2-methylcitrate dehydratase
MIRSQIEDFGGRPLTTMIGGGKTAPDRAAFYNSALVRYLDFNDTYIAKGSSCHPSDNLGVVLAASEYAGKRGKDLMTALAVAYQVQCRLSDVAPVRAHGFDHTTQGAYAVAAGVSKALGLTREQTANAIAISGTALNALRVTRTGSSLQLERTGLSLYGVWRDLSRLSGHARYYLFEGNKGFQDSIAGPFTLDWSTENLEAVRRTSVKKYNAEFHSQSALRGILALRNEQHIRPQNIERIDIAIFDVAYHIIGGGEEGNKHRVRTKEKADHSLPYMIAVALLDSEVTPAQYQPERIVREDVQALMQKVSIQPDDALSARFPQEMPCHITLKLANGQSYELDKQDYDGFYTRPLAWEDAAGKFERLARPFTGKELWGKLAEAVLHLESIEVRQLTELLANVNMNVETILCV